MTKTQIQLTPEQQERLQAIRAKSLLDRHLEGPPFPGTTGEGIRFYLTLRHFIGQVHNARESAGLSLADLSAKSGIAEEILTKLESGTLHNPTWKILGDYAHAVGVGLKLSVE